MNKLLTYSLIFTLVGILSLAKSKLYAQSSFTTIGVNNSWQSITDNEARGQGSKSKITQLDAAEDEIYKVRMRLGQRDATSRPEKVGFSRVFQDFSPKDLSGFEGVWVPLAISDTSIKLTFIIDDNINDEVSYQANVLHKYSDKERLGLTRSGGVWVAFSEFKGNKRGQLTSDIPDLSQISYFGIQLTRSIQSDSLFDSNSSIVLDLTLWSSIIAIKKMSSIVDNQFSSPIQKIEELYSRSKIEAEQVFGNRYKELLQTINLTTASAILTESSEQDFLRRIISPRIVNSPITLAKNQGAGVFIARDLFPLGRVKTTRLKVLSQLQLASRSPSITKKWLNSFLLRLAIFNRTYTADDNSLLALNAQNLEQFIRQQVNSCKVNVTDKNKVIKRPDGTFGLSLELIAQLSSIETAKFANNVFFDRSDFADVVGTYSFPLMFLFYSELVNLKPCDEYLQNETPLMTRFYSMTVSNGDGNAFEGWRLWQRLFGGSGKSLFVDPSFWKTSINVGD